MKPYQLPSRLTVQVTHSLQVSSGTFDYANRVDGEDGSGLKGLKQPVGNLRILFDDVECVHGTIINKIIYIKIKSNVFCQIDENQVGNRFRLCNDLIDLCCDELNINKFYFIIEKFDNISIELSNYLRKIVDGQLIYNDSGLQDEVLGNVDNYKYIIIRCDM